MLAYPRAGRHQQTLPTQPDAAVRRAIAGDPDVALPSSPKSTSGILFARTPVVEQSSDGVGRLRQCGRCWNRTKAATRGSPSTRAQGSAIRTLDPRSPPSRKSPHASPSSAHGPVAMEKRRMGHPGSRKQKPAEAPWPVSGRLPVGGCDRVPRRRSGPSLMIPLSPPAYLLCSTRHSGRVLATLAG
jgi:hypothetical protein